MKLESFFYSSHKQGLSKSNTTYQVQSVFLYYLYLKKKSNDTHGAVKNKTCMSFRIQFLCFFITKHLNIYFSFMFPAS